MKRPIYYIALMALATSLAACNGATGRSPDLSSQMLAQSGAQTTTPKTTVQKLSYSFGPYSLPAGTTATTMTNKDGKLSFHVDSPVWMTGFEPHVVDAKGNPLPSKLIQLAILSNGHEANPLCTTRQTSNPFAATTSLLQKTVLPEGFGYPMMPEDPLEAKIVLRNPTEEDYADVYFTFTLTAEPMDVASYKLDVATLLLDVDPCDHSPVTLPPNGMVEKKGSFVIPDDGKVIKVQGLLQDYGVSVSVDASKDAAKFSWSAMSQLDDNHQIVSLDSYENSKGAPLKKDDQISLGVLYDNFSANWVNDATAAAIVYIAHDNQKPATDMRPSSDGNRTSNQPAITATKAQKLLF